MLASSGFIAQVDESTCNECEECEDYCHFDALDMANGSNSVAEELCMGCGVCVSKCSEAAISLRLEPSKGIPLKIFDLIEDARQVSDQHTISTEVVEDFANFSEVL